MNCINCEGGIVVGRLSMPVEAPLNRKGGGLSMAGISVKQAEIKAAWDAIETGDRVIVCSSCGAEYAYVPGKGIVNKGDGAVSSEDKIVPEEELQEEEVEAPVAAAPVLKRIAPPKPTLKMTPAPSAKPVFKLKRPV